MNWENEKENLKKLIVEENLPYTTIGKMYGCTGSNIKKQAIKLGIELKPRRKINPNENFSHPRYLLVDKDTNKETLKKNFDGNLLIKDKVYCLYCGKELNNIKHKFCDQKCQNDYNYKQYIERWKQGLETGLKGEYGISNYIRRYLYEKYNQQCCECGWNKINPYTNTCPLEIDHIDGNYQNNTEDNLRLLCPNCHSLTSTYKGANKGKGRKERKRYYDNDELLQ